MRTTRLFRILFLALCFSALNVLASEADFDAANRLYAQGKFTDAANAYEKLIQTGTVSPAVYFNLGNAHFKAAEIGKAIVAYRHAEQLAPRDPDLRANLQFVRNQIQGPNLRPSQTQEWFSKLKVNEWSVLAAVAFWICLSLLIATQLQPRWKTSLRGWLLLSAVATVTLAACLFFTVSLRSTAIAVVTANEAIVRNGPLDESPSAFTVRDGAELKVLDTKDAWLQVSPDDRRVGWVKREQVQTVSQL